MGGNRKQANRTKNNARPANSGRSAELLGNTPPPFVGFSAVKDGAFVSVLPGFSTNVDDINPNVDPNFQLLLKKMNKKDSTTKLKALQEFSELVQASEVEAVKAILPFWPRLYCQLATDIEHRVREALHQTQRVVVSKAKRNIAPFLKQLAGPWFTSQYDTYAPAASAAQMAFQEAFPPNKQLEAINFCQEEILAYISDNLTVQTAQTLSNPKTTEPEQMEAKHQRVLVCSLHGYVLYLQKLTHAMMECTREANIKLVSSAKFWKLAKHSAPLVRSAWFSVVIALCQKSPDLMVLEASHVVRATLGRLDETDPSVLPIVWEAALHVVTTVPDCWSHINADKVVLPKLYHMTREGGQGNAASVFPNLLPLLSKLPENISCDKRVFYDKFFNSMRSGFTQRCVVQSPSESNAVAKCYVECLKYAIVTSQKDIDFCQHLVKNQLMLAIKLVLTDQRLGLFYTTYFIQLSLLVHQWDRNRDTPLNAQLLKTFWLSLEELNATCLDPAHEDSMEPQRLPDSWLLERQVSLCLHLRNPIEKHTVGRRVKFGGSAAEFNDIETSSVTAPIDHSDEYTQSLFVLINSLCVTYFSLTQADNTTCFLNCLSKLVTVFSSKELFMSFLNLSSPDEIMSRTQAVINVFKNQLEYWMKNDKNGIEPVINITLVLLEHLEASERTAVMEAVSELCVGPSAAACLTASLKHRANEDIAQFLRGERTARALMVLAQACCAGTSRLQDWELLTEFFTARTLTGDFVISDEVFCNLVGVFECDSGSEFTSDYLTDLADVFFGERLCEDTVMQAEKFFIHLLGVAVVVPDYLPVIEKATPALKGAGRLDGLIDSVAMFAYKKLEVITRTSGVVEGYESDINLVVTAVFTFLKAAAGDYHPVEVMRRFLEACTPRVTSLEPLLTYLTGNGYQRCHSWSDYSGFCECRELRPANNLSFDEALTLHLGGIVFHFFLLEKLFPGEQLPDEHKDDAEETVFSRMLETKWKPATEVEKSTSFSPEVFKPLEAHIALLSKSLEICSAFGVRFSSTVYNYKISMRFLAVAHVYTYMSAWAPLIVDTRVLCSASQIDDGHLRLPWNSPTPFPDDKVEETDTNDEHKRAHCIPTAELLKCWPNIATDSIDALEIFDALILLNRDQFLFECDLRDKPERQVVALGTLAEFMSRLVTTMPQKMSPKQWDFVVVALASWIQCIRKSKHSLLTPSPMFPVHPPTARPEETEEVHAGTSGSVWEEVNLPRMTDAVELYNHNPMEKHHHGVVFFTETVCRLFTDFYKLLDNVITENKKRYATHNKMKQEWTDVFKRDSHDALIDVFRAIVEWSRHRKLSLLDLPAIEAVMLALQSFDVGKNTQNEKLMGLVECCLEAKCSHVLVLQLAAFHIMHSLALNLAVKDSADLLTTDDPAAQSARLTLHTLLPHLADAQTVVTAMLASVRPGESCLVSPYTDAGVYTVAYLSLWTVVLSMCEQADSVLRSQYAAILREKDYLDQLLRAVFRLMPEEVLAVSHGKSRSRKTSELFSVAPHPDLGRFVTSTVIEQTACWVYWLCLRWLPAEVRKWWSNADQRFSSMVDRVTTNHVSPVLCDLEMKTLMTHVPKQKSKVVIKVHPSVYEVHAMYTVDDVRLELSMALPANYPLSPVSVNTTNTEKLHEGGKEGRGWLLQLRMFLTHQNGSLWEGLSLWKNNLDKRFDGVEECCICYSIIHSSNFELPRVMCHTCKKKFHRVCMFKWINTSTKSTCPICRNLF